MNVTTANGAVSGADPVRRPHPQPQAKAKADHFAAALAHLNRARECIDLAEAEARDIAQTTMLLRHETESRLNC